MNKGLKIALIVVGAFLSVCGILFLVSFFTGSRVNRGVDGDFYGGRGWNNSGMPGGMMRRWNRSSSNDDLYLERWAAILGISQDELKSRLDAGESLESIAESQGVDMPCWNNDADEDADPAATPTSYSGWGLGAGMCF